MDAESNNTGGPLEARKAFRRCISYVYLPHITARTNSQTTLDGGDDTEKIIVAAFKRYCVSNPLHPDVFPGASSSKPHYSFMHVLSACSCPQNGGRSRGNVPQDASSNLLPTRAHFLIDLKFCTGITILMALVLLPPVVLNPSSCRARLTVVGRWPPRVSLNPRCKLVSVPFSTVRY